MTEKKDRVLVIDDEKNIRELSKKALERIDIPTETAPSAEEGLNLIKKEKFDLILLDMVLPGMSGLDMIDKIKRISPGTEIIIITGKATIENAVECMKKGVYDYITKPFEIRDLRIGVRKGLEKKRLVREVSSLKQIVSIYEGARALRTLMPVNELLEKIFKLARDSVGADGGSVGIYNEKTDTLDIVVAGGTHADAAKERKINIGDRVCGWVFEKKEPVLIQSSIKDDDRFKHLKELDEIKSGMSVPIIIRDRVIGVLNLKITGRDRRFTEVDLKLITIFAEQAASAIQNAKIYEQLKKLDELKTEFIAGASHELKTPVQSILNACEILIKDSPDNRMLKLLIRNARRMKKLILQLLDFSKIEKGEYKLNLKKCDVSKLIDEVMEEIRSEAEKKEIVLNKKTGRLPAIKIDPEAIKRVLLNIIDNAVKYCPPKSKVTVTGKILKENIRISIRDNGPGIPYGEQEKIFKKFYQQKPDKTLTRKHPGLGLGLSMVKEIIIIHKGKIRLESEPGRGSTFHFTLPR